MNNFISFTFLLFITIYSNVLIADDTITVSKNMYYCTDDRLMLVNQDIKTLNYLHPNPKSCIKLDQIYTFKTPVVNLEVGKKYIVLNSYGHERKLYFTGLPIISINSNYKIVDEPKVLAHFTLIEPDGTSLSSNIGVEYRGITSQMYVKKSMRVEFWNDTVGNQKQDYSLLGMRSDNDWNLQAMYAEPLKLRSISSFELWQQIDTLYYKSQEPKANNSVNQRYVEVFINGVYWGIYALSEPIDRKQLKLDKNSGVLYKSAEYGDANGFILLPPYSNDSSYWSGFEQDYPETIDWKDIYSLVELVLRKNDSTFRAEYPSMISIKNAANYFIFLNLVSALDNKVKNCFYAKYTKQDPFFILPWDLDGTFGSDWAGQLIITPDFFLTNTMFNRMLGDNTQGGFTDVLLKRWFELRKKIITNENIMAIFRKNYTTLMSNGVYEREERTFFDYKCDTTHLAHISNWIDDRIVFLDSTFAELSNVFTTSPDIKDADEIEIYPNPIRNYFYINVGTANLEHRLRIINTLGQQVYVSTFMGNTKIDVSNLEMGVYYLVVGHDDRVITKKIIKE